MPERIRWRNEDGRVVSGYVAAVDEQTDEYVVNVPNWTNGDIQQVRVHRSAAVVGEGPWES